ncbi:exopolysaccharide biosynthesis polyprenyl glycosylphosphotransferase [Winogradskyella maritima]|uniref:Exopolysaccharide biosynthesis polyprenyl glycosylphosphotransferase n=1 Tax=Winogradskyella maritima TaxID=1517766 RepID=A0ABV8AH23_9FLAO|nr:exopolysaccharide biosynthesis polyprenyl glycosylphosphotransferase [Winogradskyella maritima]
MSYIRGRYSWLIRPSLILFDTATILVLAFYFFDFDREPIEAWFSYLAKNKSYFFVIYAIILWLISAYSIKFYDVYRYTSALDIATLLFKQMALYFVGTFAFVGFFRSITVGAFTILQYIGYAFLFISIIKFASYFALRQYRRHLNGNKRFVLIIGNNDVAKELQDFFKRKRDYGYELKGVYSNLDSLKVDGNIQDGIKHLKEDQGIDEVYCAMDELSEKQVNTFVKYADINHCNIKFIPASKNLLSKHLKTDFYNYLPVLSIQEVTLKKPFNVVVKRGFDIIFSLFVIIFILSWLSIILFILIKLESKGPLYYKHKRNGINYKEFECYKFRSLKLGSENGTEYVKKKDHRVTKIGAFLRRTSLDELPQFYNVLFGDMSVVGPRPHMLSFTDDYSKKIDKYNFVIRHNVKPGITGLAQTKGFRGEVKKDEDIINRVKFDIYYIENWSLLLDIKIIIDTIVLIIKGDKKAY